MASSVGLVDPFLPVSTFDAEHRLSVPMVALCMVFMCVFMDVLGGNISYPVMPYYVRSFGVGSAAVGYLFSVFELSALFCAPVLGSLSDRFGRRPILLVSLLGAGLAGFFQGYAPTYWELLMARAFSGIWGAVLPVAQVYVADVCPSEVLPDYMAYLLAVPGVAQSIGPALGGVLARFGLNIPVLVDGSLSFVVAVLVYVFLPESPAWKAGQAAQNKNIEATRPNVIPTAAFSLGVSNAFCAMGLFSSNAMLPIVFAAKFGFGPLQVGCILSVAAIVRIFAGIWITPRLSRLFGQKYAAGLGSFVNGTFLIVSVCVSDMQLSALSLVIARIGAAIRLTLSGSILAAVTEPWNRARVF